MSALAVGGWRHIPNWRPGGSVPAKHSAAFAAFGAPMVLPKDPLVLCLGDSLTYGADRLFGVRPPTNASSTWRVRIPYPDYLAQHYDGRAKIVGAGYPGDRAVDGLEHWRGQSSPDLTILMYGTNDANPRRWPGQGSTLEDYHEAMTALIMNLRAAGSKILVLAPPTAATHAAVDAIAPYRLASRIIALENSVAFADSMAAINHIPVPFQYDGLHLKTDATEAIGRMIVSMITLPSDSR